MTVWQGAALIFGLRIIDVSIGTLRTMYLVRGDRVRAVPLAFCEALIWILAVSRIMKMLNEPITLVAYAAGFATGTFVGITLERWIASGWILARIVTDREDVRLIQLVRDAGFGVTVVHGEGREQPQAILFVVTLRKRGQELLELVRKLEPEAFVTIDSVQTAMGGYLPVHVPAASLRK